MSDVVTVRQGVQRAHDEGLPVSDYAVRQWIKRGDLAVYRSGKWQYFYYPNLVALLEKLLSVQDGGLQRKGDVPS